MPINILMPALSPTMEKGNLAKWLKKEGDAVKSGDVIAEIETDKATMEVEAVDEGTLAKIVVPEGTADVPVNQVIAVLAGEGEDVKAAASAAPKGAHRACPEAAETPASLPLLLHLRLAAARQPKPAPQPRPPVTGARRRRAGARLANRIFSSPLARRLAKESGLELSRIQGSGPHGRVMARDIDAAQSGKGLKPAAAPGADRRASMHRHARRQDPRFVRAGLLRNRAARQHAQGDRAAAHGLDPDHSAFLSDHRLQHRQAHGRARGDQCAAPKDKDGKPTYKLSVNDFVIKALALALQRIPNANVSWTEGGMLRHKHSDVGVAVAMPGGLITPIIRKAETKSLSAISNEMQDLAARARGRKLKPEEYQGGTTAVSNLGMYGIKDFTAVINPPHATILAVGAGEERAIARNGKVEAAWMMSVTLSCDHRAVDGALGAELIVAFKALIENPVMMVV